MADRFEYLILLAGFLVIMNDAVVRSESVQKCYNDTGIPWCFIADKDRDKRLKTWQAATDYCQKLGGAGLPTVTTLEDQFRLTRFLTENDFLVDSVWLGGRGVTNEYKWTWMDGRTYSDPLGTSSLSPSFAAVSKEPDGNATLVALNTNDVADGFICQYKGQTVCNRGDSEATYTDGVSCFARFRESIHWLLARNKCLMRGADLATLTDESEAGLKTMLDRLQYKAPEKQSEQWMRYWVGLRKIWWKWTNDNTEVLVAYFKDKPTLEISTIAEQNCLTLDYRDQFAWSSRNCSIPFQTICQGDFEDNGTTKGDTSTQAASYATTPTVTLPVWAVGLISGLAGVVYIVSLIVVGVLCCKCRRGDETPKKNGNETGNNRRKNSYVAEEPSGTNDGRPAVSGGNGAFDGVYADDEFDDEYDEIEANKRPVGPYANHIQMATAPGVPRRPR